MKHHFLCAACGSRDHWLLTRNVGLYHVQSTRCEFQVNLMMFVTLQLLPVASRGHFDSESIWVCRCVQGGSLMKHEKFGADWTKYAEFIITSCFMAKDRKSPPWVRVNIDMHMCSGWECHHSWEIWGRLGNVWWRYKNFLLNGVGSKFTAWPRPHASVKTHHHR